MTTNKIVRTKLMSYAHENVYDTINNRSNVVDPKNSNDLTRNLVYKNDPWSKGSDYDGYPYIIVRFPSISKEAVSADGNHKNITWQVNITVRTAMGGAINDNQSAGITDMQSIVDDLNETFDSKTIKDTLRALDMYKVELEDLDNDELVDDNGKHIFESEFRLSFTTRMKVGVA